MRVLLIEAGPDAPAGAESADIRNPYPASAANEKLFWPALTAEGGAAPRDAAPRPTTPYLQALGVGGGSNVNGMLADRGHPADYDEWRDSGAEGWGWSDVLPYFIRLEHDMDFDGPLHGKNGPIPVRRVPPGEWAPLARALANVFVRNGAPLVADANGAVRNGVAAAPMNSLPERRVSVSMAYLTADVRRRANLTILANATAERILVRGGRACGLSLRIGQQTHELCAREIVLACGAIHSPAVLLRSGLGPAAQLQGLRIPIVRDLPGVGRNLQNHPLVPLALYLKPAGMQAAHQRQWQQNLLRYSSQFPGCADTDMLLLISNILSWHALGRRMAGIGVFVLKAYSRGYVELLHADPATEPRVRFNLLDDGRDFERMVSGVRLALGALSSDEVAKLSREVFVPDSTFGARLAKANFWNATRARMISMVLRADPVRRMALRGKTLDVNALAGDEEAIRAYVRRYAQAVYHVCGTCRMGATDDPLAVVDSACRVRGIEALRVVDASVFPTVPSACTRLPVIMVAEKMTDQIKRTGQRIPHGNAAKCRCIGVHRALRTHPRRSETGHPILRRAGVSLPDTPLTDRNPSQSPSSRTRVSRRAFCSLRPRVPSMAPPRARILPPNLATMAGVRTAYCL